MIQYDSIRPNVAYIIQIGAIWPSTPEYAQERRIMAKYDQV